MLSLSLEAKKKKKWSGDVETKWEPPEGFFEQSPAKIASELKKNSKDRRQATARLNFYINRAGKNLSKEDRKRLEAAKVLLAAMYDEEEKKGKKKVSNESHSGSGKNRSEFIRAYKDFLSKSHLRPEEAVVGAGGACLMYGIRQTTNDMDVAVSENVFKVLLKSGKYNTHEFQADPQLPPIVVLEWSDFIDLHASDMSAPTTMVDGVCCWTPEYTLAFKKQLNRPKDQEDIKALERLLKRGISFECHPSIGW